MYIYHYIYMENEDMKKFSKMRNYLAQEKKQIINHIIRTIQENKTIKLSVLIAKLTIEEPYLGEQMAMKYVKNLSLIQKIEIDDFNEVSVCQ